MHKGLVEPARSLLETRTSSLEDYQHSHHRSLLARDALTRDKELSDVPFALTHHRR
jgi:hypothetical protein